MIKLARDRNVPRKLSDEGPSGTQALINAYEEGLPIATQNRIYGHKSVKDHLRKSQHSKCAFCETKLDQQFGHVEHFRPKMRWRATRSSAAQSPGYFWLAYHWENLILSCEVCNTRYKRDYFPLRDEAGRANPMLRDISSEDPLLIDPFTEDPQIHLEFKDWNIASKGGSLVGETTIEGLGLGSAELDECRRDRLAGVELILQVLEEGVPCSEASHRAKEFLREAISETGEYSAMIRDNLGTRIEVVLGA